MFAHIGTAASLPFQVAPVTAGFTAPVGERPRLVLGDRREESGLGELGHEHGIEAHEIDRLVLRREPAQQLLALVARAPRQQRRLDPVAALRALGAAAGDLGLAAVVGVDVPLDHGRTAAAFAAAAPGDGQREHRDDDRGPRCGVGSLLAHATRSLRGGLVSGHHMVCVIRSAESPRLRDDRSRAPAAQWDPPPRRFP